MEYTDTERLHWLMHTLNDLYSNVTRDVFGMASDDEGDISVAWIDLQMHVEDF